MTPSPAVPSDATDPPGSADRGVLPLLDLAGPLAERVRRLGASQVNLYRALAHTPELLTAWIDWAWALRERCHTPRPLREIMILRTAAVMRSEYEWHQHVAMAENAGVPMKKMDAVAAWQTSDFYEPHERAALMLTDAMLTGHVPDAVHDELARHFTDAERVELILTAGFYAMVPRVLDACRVPLEDAQTDTTAAGHDDPSRM